ncbi:MAG: CbiX/SirB N-terminal domain-containing protein [Pseudomonadota bacterium]|nr:CbiX/SirB N-terminal domain-containing protein [Pseudomonadota bacterium]
MSTATILFAHGSRDPAWRAPIEAVAARMRQLAPARPVACAYLELTAPDLPTAVRTLHAEGAEHIAIWPMFIGAGRHLSEDLPRLLTGLRTAHPHLRLSLHPAIAEHPAVLQAMAQAALGLGSD